MKYKIIFFLLLTSCLNNAYTSKKNFTYSAKGFAFIDSQSFINSGSNFFASHNKLKSGTKITITNPVNEVSIEAIIKKKIEHDNFYKVSISSEIETL